MLPFTFTKHECVGAFVIQLIALSTGIFQLMDELVVRINSFIMHICDMHVWRFVFRLLFIHESTEIKLCGG